MVRVIARDRMSGCGYEFAAYIDQYRKIEATEEDLTPYAGPYRGAAARRVWLSFRCLSSGGWEDYPLPHSNHLPFAARFVRKFETAELISPALRAVAETLADVEAKRIADEEAIREEQLRLNSIRYAHQLYVDGLVKGLHGKKREISIPLVDADSRTVQATCYGVRATGHFGVWAIHRSLVHGATYTVTHAGTGLAAIKDVSLRDAKAVVSRLLAECPEWREGIPAQDSPAKLRALAVIRAPWVPAEEILRKTA